MVLRKRGYGNYFSVADKVWRSIVNLFSLEAMKILTRDSQYRQHMGILRGKIGHQLIISERRKNIYIYIDISNRYNNEEEVKARMDSLSKEMEEWKSKNPSDYKSTMVYVEAANKVLP